MHCSSPERSWLELWQGMPQKKPRGWARFGAFLRTIWFIFTSEIYPVESLEEREFPPRIFPCCLAVSLLRQESWEGEKQPGMVQRALMGKRAHIPHPVEPTKASWWQARNTPGLFQGTVCVSKLIFQDRCQLGWRALFLEKGRRTKLVYSITFATCSILFLELSSAL